MVLFFLVILISTINSCDEQTIKEPILATEVMYIFPEESEPHEATWLQWPHHYQYGIDFRDDLDPTWVELAKELITSEKVHIIAYDETEKSRIIALLNAQSVDLTNVGFYIYPTDDFWVRDNGPIYVYDHNGNLVIQDWGFNGWGNKADYADCNTIPTKIGQDQNRTVVDLNSIMVNEGGSVELDGNGTLMACKSSILNKNRNRGMTQVVAENIFQKYLGATHFIWLDGQKGLDITDQHIDGFARFGNSNTIVTMNNDDLLAYDVLQSDIDKLYAAKNKDGVAYTFLKLPLTQNNVVTTYGKDLGYKGSYCNYYIANTKVIVPIYNDPNDVIALQKIQTIYPNRTVVGIDFRNVYANGGMTHCVTQQQPKER
ncbi:agmatine/peptidylarginine deiminase [Allomuricauda sp. SCSIO 65647]|uniref:agmatine deiminase family protein n=1 Tax=Allomuricauda sp. SCSIO 65647 TaxID=2908843 RepID=UPI001F1A751E|nr:agmatine deiminase family protein [Muricauda sp. SCSIO 65647]UJH67695.1 agmatine deiminase family protein [Muricauda sp. SCSIO 65647]